ncbi:UDP-N-acetylmuramoyl-L-alanine--D-glutamate ligase [Robbsia sp. Bb-Pol-6]|uniref:UDP-N-acetylmuramoylalanine--D-glutamate ligase n=1 Tax=Robbsia betulipollinis TaxID=2981849 RepID=A0ABT3ZQW5_9BURK|nr:UDP-N-acetylmuramoyl-L-alanine--D-glutamate ligase [Robbsia betulipollinis]MCY0388948.1 UDP-N-acetylmuramoyl-L-alanine--D-glutamate ligase [Robbsia betulipollinis]
MFGGPDRPRVLVLGLGESGLAMARWCALHGCTLRLADSRQAPPNLATALALEGGPHAFAGGTDAPNGPFPPALLDDAIDLVAISPGLSPLDPALTPLLDAARGRDIPVWGELAFFSHALRARNAVLAGAGAGDDAVDGTGTGTGKADGVAPAQVIAITGTNGKTTTTALTGQLVARAGRSVAVAGNISPSMLDRLMTAIEQDALPQVWVLELSSFQLETAQDFAPDVAVVLNITQDHLDWHGSFDAYAAAKLRIFGPTTRAVINRDDPHASAWLVKAGAGRPASLSFGTDAPVQAGDFGIARDAGLAWLAQTVRADGEDAAAPGSERDTGMAGATGDTPSRRRTRRAAPAVETQVRPLMPVDALRIRGLHNASNALAALALCRAIGLPLALLLHGLREYRGEPHRVECLATLDGVDYVDDSKATNVGAAAAALDGLAAPIVLIAGGDGKGQDFAPLAPGVTRWCKAVMLIGRDAPLLRAALADCGVALHDQPTLEAATAAAARLAQAGDTVLLSPACASFDMFRNYAHRADVFRQCVAEIAAEQGVTL